jgi:hypothetical protein
MKKLLTSLLLVGIVAILIVSCKKDEVKTVLKTGISGTLTVSSASPALSVPTANDTIETFTWTPSDYGYSAAVKYSLQIGKVGTNFATPKVIDMGAVKTKKLTVGEINQIALLQGIAFGTAGQLEARVKSTISDSISAVYSNKVTISLTPYQVLIVYPSLWVPGDYQGWDPPSAPKLASKNSDGIYEGFVNIPGGTLQFKINSDPDWNHTNYGDGGAGTLSTAGGNLTVPTAGYYYITANTNNLTWKATKKTWGIIGDAPILANNWSNDVPMTYSTVTGKWSVTTNFNAGGFKFRANSDWGDPKNNFGDNSPADGVPDYNGGNITITAGTHTVTLDLHIPGNYTYTIL